MTFTAQPEIVKRSQLVLETTYGTLPGSPTYKRLPNYRILPAPEAETIEYQGQGFINPSLEALSKEWTKLTIEGPMTYGEMVYVFASLLKGGVTPSIVDTSAQKWVFAPSTSNPDTPASFSMQHGDDILGGWQFSGAAIDGATFSFSRKEQKVSGTAIAQKWQTGVNPAGGGAPAMAALGTLTNIENVENIPNQTSVFLDSTFANLGTTQLTGPFMVEWSLTNRWKPIWVLDGTQGSFVALVQAKPKSTVKLTLQADSVSDAFMAQIRAGTTKYLQIKSTSPVLAGAATQYYQQIIDLPVQVTKPGALKGEDDVYVQEWELASIADPTAGFAYRATVYNKTSTL